MVQSANIVNGVNCRIMLAKAVSLVLVDISGETNAVTINFTNALEDARTFGGGGWATKFGGMLSGTVNLTAYYSKTTDEALQLWRTWLLTYPDESRILQVDIPNDNPGSDRYTLPCKIANCNIGEASAGTSAPIPVTAELQVSGAPTPSTIAT